MTIEQFLKQAWYIRREIYRIDAEIRELRAEMFAIGSPSDMSIPAVDHSAAGDEKIINLISAYEGLLDERTKRYYKLVAVLRDVHRVIDGVEDAKLRELLTLRYLDHMNWEGIADNMHYTWRYIYDLRLQALEAAETIWKRPQ